MITDIAEIKSEPTSAGPQADAPSTAERIQYAVEICQQAASGNLDVRILHIHDAGNLGRLFHCINHLLDMADAFVRESEASSLYASRGKFFRRVLLDGMLGAFRVAGQTINSATDTMDQRNQALTSIVKNLENSTKEIDKVVNVIKAISDRTNLLAINARIEAARAGESGRGFSIVADEVKSLAKQTAQATLGIHEQMELIQTTTHDAVRAIDRSGNTDI